ncbi:MAG: hypothetical protein FWD73_01160 [Polyangiaceae bacterium]|nr:hypothetical protein [Polyangiaceae bacterium]
MRVARAKAMSWSMRGFRDVSDASDVTPPELGEVLSRRYELEHALMRTAVSVVFEAKDRSNGNCVAIEVGTARDLEGRARFHHDAAVARRLEGAHVLHMLDVGTLPDGSPFVVREFALTTLADEVHRRSAIPIEQAVAWTLEVCEAVAEAHSLGIVHGTIDPYHVYVAHYKQGQEATSIKLAWPGRSVMEGGHEQAFAPGAVLTPAHAEIDIAGVGSLLDALITGHIDVGDTEITPVVLPKAGRPVLKAPSKGVPPDVARVIARAVCPDDGEAFKNIADLADALVPFGPLGHPSARNSAFLLARGGLLPQSKPLVTPSPERQAPGNHANAAPEPSPAAAPRRASRPWWRPLFQHKFRGSGVALVVAAALGAAIGAALLLAGTSEHTHDAKSKDEPKSGAATITSGVVTSPPPEPVHEPVTDAPFDAPPHSEKAVPAAREARIGRFEITVPASPESPPDTDPDP